MKVATKRVLIEERVTVRGKYKIGKLWREHGVLPDTIYGRGMQVNFEILRGFASISESALR
jgi:hypothetical protein